MTSNMTIVIIIMYLDCDEMEYSWNIVPDFVYAFSFFSPSSRCVVHTARALHHSGLATTTPLAVSIKYVPVRTKTQKD